MPTQDLSATHRQLLSALERIEALLTSGPIGPRSGERYVRADLIREVLDEVSRAKPARAQLFGHMAVAVPVREELLNEHEAEVRRAALRTAAETIRRHPGSRAWEAMRDEAADLIDPEAENP